MDASFGGTGGAESGTGTSGARGPGIKRLVDRIELVCISSLHD